MSAKIIVRKYDNDNNFQCLDIIIEDEDNFSTKANFGQWSDEKIYPQKKENEKSTRLVVKIVLDNHLDILNLDTCAKELQGEEQHLVNSPMLAGNGFTLDSRNTKIPKDYFSHLIVTDQKKLVYDCNENPSRKNIFVTPKDSYAYSDRMSPLEYGLEKVKETNANIMKNIQMLNRTLNYTKKREMLDIFCPKSSRMFPCNTCGKCFVYETGLKRHCAMRHAIIEMQPRWQVVWTCIECFQVWPCQGVALKHAILCCKSNTEDCIREIKTSSLLQCEFCEKVFTSIPRLLRHSKVHTIAYNYQCNACELNFSSYKIAEQHWLSCQWLRIYYRFSLPKHYLCNACDRKFRNYEQLYNHRYKAEHFIAKFNNINGSKTPFYQCEICGQCFPSTTPLHMHRNQYHPCFDTGIQGHIITS